MEDMGGYFLRILDSPTWGHTKCRLVRFMGQRGHMGVSLKMYGLTGYVCDHGLKSRCASFSRLAFGGCGSFPSRF